MDNVERFVRDCKTLIRKDFEKRLGTKFTRESIEILRAEIVHGCSMAALAYGMPAETGRAVALFVLSITEVNGEPL